MQNYNSKFKNNDIKSRAYAYALEAIKLIENLPKDSVCQVIGKQLLRSGTSIGANIIEARASSSKRDFINFFNYSLKSANESRFWLDLLKDSGKIKAEEITNIYQETIEIANILASSIITMKGKNKF